MSAATAPAVNGTSAPSSSSSTPAAAAAPAAAGGKPTVQPSEVGWLFVPQYYTFLNQNPGSLHRFYTKKSTLVHGTELEDTSPCFGQQEIHQKITSLGFEDCKVFVSNVDSQSSASGGIIIQVLGEMSNAAGPWRKFAQTFFLAEQPNGYFVLNDIFRFLKEEDDEEVEEGAEPAAAAAAPAEEQAAPAVVEAPREPEAPAPVAAAPEPVAEAAPEPAAAAEVQAAPEPAAEPAAAAAPVVVNGAQSEAASDPAKPNEAGLDNKVAVVKADSAPAPPAVAAAKEEAPAAPAPAAKSAPAPEPAAPAVPAAPKTWANLAASNAKSWGSNISAEARGISAARPAAAKQQGGTSPAAANVAASGSGANGAAPRAPTNAPAAGQPQTLMQQALSHDSKSVFIKNVLMEHMPEEGLQAALEAQFGPMSECQVVPSKACAFGTFATVDAARRAIAMSLRIQDGGKGGVPVGNKGWTVTVAQKKGLGERPPPRDARGGAPGGDRGSFRGGRGGARGGAAGRGRGGAPAASPSA